jgi:hypothetical protein
MVPVFWLDAALLAVAAALMQRDAGSAKKLQH